jgi:hypothetical protein
MLSISENLLNIINYLFIPFLLLLAIQKKWAWLLLAGTGLGYVILTDFDFQWFSLFQLCTGIYGFYVWHTTEKLAPAYIPEKIDESLLDTMYTIPEAPLRAGGFSLPTQSKDFQLVGIVIGLYLLFSLASAGFFMIFNLLSLDTLYNLLDIVGMCLLIQKRRLGFVFLIATTVVVVFNISFNYPDIFTPIFVIQPAISAILCIAGYQKWSKG